MNALILSLIFIPVYDTIDWPLLDSARGSVSDTIIYYYIPSGLRHMTITVRQPLGSIDSTEYLVKYPRKKEDKSLPQWNRIWQKIKSFFQRLWEWLKAPIDWEEVTKWFEADREGRIKERR